MLTEGELVRFWPKVDVKTTNEECWPWTAAPTDGYGRFRREGGPMEQAHRVMWEAMHGQIPEGLCVLHTCDNRLCVNPLHLFLGTRADNSADCVAKERQARGERHGQAKLNREQVLEIRALVAEGELQRVVGRCFGVAQTTVGHIARRIRWAWLDEAVVQLRGGSDRGNSP